MHYTSRIILDNKMRLLEPLLYHSKCPIDNWQMQELLFVEPLKYETLTDWQPVSLGHRWRSQFDHTQVFRAQAVLPAEYGDKQAMLLLDFGGEGLVRINGEIISGVVSYTPGGHLRRQQRTRVVIPRKYQPGDVLEIEVECCLNFLEYCWPSISNLEVGPEYVFTQAEFALVDEVLEAYYFDLRCAVDALDTFENPFGTLAESNARIHNGTVRQMMNILDADRGLRGKLYNVILASINQLDLEFGYDRLIATVPAASEVLKNGLASIPEKAHFMVKMVGHSHIDTAWLWPLKETVRKCGKTFSNVLALMEKYPEFIFCCSQPQLFAYAEEYYPELFEKLKQRIAEGRIELVGNAWVEMDANVPSGESLVRQLLYGRQYYLEKFGKASRVFWMPDVFGYSWAMPQIMKRSGVDYFFTSKLGNNDTNNFPHSLFHWQGVDGTRILSFLQTKGYNGNVDAATIRGVRDEFRQSDVLGVSLMPVGYGDGGGGPNYQMLENAQRLKEFPGLPCAEFATAESFFQEAEQVQDKLPVWNDEMYYEFHRGTYTSQSETKKNNRKGELFLRRTEMACAMAAVLLGREYPARRLGDLWKLLLTNQFHDILPGSSIAQVYDDCDVIYGQMFAGIQELYDAAIADLNDSLGIRKDQVAVWNFLSWNTGGTVSVSMEGSYAGLTDSDGTPVPATAVNAEGKTTFTFEAKDVPPMGVRIYTAVETAVQTVGTEVSAAVLENDHLRLTLDENGNILSLFDKHAGREAFEKGRLSNLLIVFEDIPHRESAWNIDVEYQNRFWTLEKAEKVELVEAGPARSVVRVVRKFNLSTVTQDIVLERDSRRVDFITHVDWQERQRMLKTAFYPDVLSSKATYEIQFGSIERPTHWNTSYDKARFEVCGHKWADLSEGMYGVSLLNDCKYGYDIKDNCMRLTLLRATVYPDPDGDRGEHDFVYSIYPHDGDWRTGETVREAYRLNVPLMASVGRAGADATTAAANRSFAAIHGAGAVIDTIKGAEDGDGMILRVYESKGARGQVVVEFGFPLKDASECNLMEDYERDIPVDCGRLCFDMKPYEIKTFRIHKA